MKRKEFKKALRTSDHREAVRRVNLESVKADALFDQVRQKVHSGAQTPVSPAIMESTALQMIARWFHELETKSEAEYDNNFGKLTPEDKHEILEALKLDEAVYLGIDEAYDTARTDSERELFKILTASGVTISKDDALFIKLAALVRKGRLENIRRNMRRLFGDAPEKNDDRIWQVHSDIFSDKEHISKKPNLITLGEMLGQFENEKADRSTATVKAYQMPIKLLKEVIGESTTLDEVKREHLVNLRDLLERVPVNAVQRFKGKTYAQAADEADMLPDIKRLDGRTAENYFKSIITIFNYAVRTCEMSKNPAVDVWSRYGRSRKRKKKVLFTIEQLNKIFKAPLYTGCQDDEGGYAKTGAMLIKRGRFWVPLLALFHGLRLNEACQLYTEDVHEKDGILYLDIREESEDGSVTEKRLKTTSSERQIPIHNELMRMGFMSFVEGRRLDRKQLRLFPELTLGKTGKYSDPFQKWFSRFLSSALGSKPSATFHSFRHMFRDALRDADIKVEVVNALGGWRREENEGARYGHGFKIPKLKTEIDKVRYDGLSLDHLYMQ